MHRDRSITAYDDCTKTWEAGEEEQNVSMIAEVVAQNNYDVTEIYGRNPKESEMIMTFPRPSPIYILYFCCG